MLSVAQSRPEWETAYLAAVISLNTTARGCELKGLKWSDIDMPGRILTIQRSKTLEGQRSIPLTDDAYNALLFLRMRAERFGQVNRSHYVFGSFTPKFTFQGTKIVGYSISAYDPTTPQKSWRSAWRTLTKEAGLSGFRFHDLRHCAITHLAENGVPDSIIMAIAGHVSRRMLERYSHVRMEAKRKALQALSGKGGVPGYATNDVANLAPANKLPV